MGCAADPYAEDRYRRFADLLGSRASDVLDIGCGPGTGGTALAVRRSVRLVGLDSVRRSLDELPPAYDSYLCAELPTIPAPSEAFDAVIAAEVIAHLHPDDVQATFQECYRVLRCGGRLLLTTTNPGDLKRWVRSATFFGASRFSKFAPKELITLLAAEGFSEAHVEGCGRTARYLGRRWPLTAYGSYLLTADKPGDPVIGPRERGAPSTASV